MDHREWLSIGESPKASRFNVLPCSVKYSGNVDGSKFIVETSPSLRATFRGRPLEGKLVDLDALGYCGHTLKTEDVADIEDDSANESNYELREVRKVPNGNSFDKLVVWEHGNMPSSTDPWASKLEELLVLAKYL